MQLAVCFCGHQGKIEHRQLAERLCLPVAASESELPAGCTHVLWADQAGLALGGPERGKNGPAATRVDFLDPAFLYRLRTTGKSQGLGKALGLAKNPELQVLDATAGLGKDGLLMAWLGCELTLLERSPVVHALLADGIERARTSLLETASEAVDITEEQQRLAKAIERTALYQIEARDYFTGISQGRYKQPDVIYLDPMFPPRNKSARVKKDIALLQEILGVESDFPSLLTAARAAARLRVVVKQPGRTPAADVPSPSFVVPGKTAHFEVYVSSAVSIR